MTQNRPNPSQRPQNQATARANNNRGNRGRDFDNNERENRGGGGNNNREPSPWLNHPQHTLNRPDQTASFVEYLRWMRSHDSDYKEATRDLILQMATDSTNYSKLLQQRNDRTRRIAQAREGVTFCVMCPWRIRVGGHRGPESILLPAFDSLGIPYIPSSTLTGVARTAAIREFMNNEGISWKEAEKRIAPYFGSIDVKDNQNKAGKVVFLDAYPSANNSAGVTVDMANSIWRWENDRLGDYSPNPNPFLSLKETTFLVGICKMPNCDEETVSRVKKWLIQGLQSGIGSQINSGYGEVLIAGEGIGTAPFWQVDFELEGQLIHGAKKFNNLRYPFQREKNGDLRRDQNGRLKTDQKSVSEVRPIAFKSMLRYWFRVIARGLMSPQDAKTWESRIFGAIDPQSRGWLTVRVQNGETLRDTSSDKTKDVGLQKGNLCFYFSSECPQNKKTLLETLIKNLTWLMFSLGGVGQGARRPLYSRKNRKNPNPPWRGSSINSPSLSCRATTTDKFADEFSQNLRSFCKELTSLSGINKDYLKFRSAVNPTDSIWTEALDKHCLILVMTSSSSQSIKPDPFARPPKNKTQTTTLKKISGEKPQSLFILHQLLHPLLDVYLDRNKSRDERQKALTEPKNLSGHTDKDYPNGRERGATPSPIWIANHGNYQVITVFGATQDPRKAFVERLRRAGAIQIFPLQ